MSFLDMKLLLIFRHDGGDIFEGTNVRQTFLIDLDLLNFACKQIELSRGIHCRATASIFLHGYNYLIMSVGLEIPRWKLNVRGWKVCLKIRLLYFDAVAIAYFVKLKNIKQGELCLSSFDQSSQLFAVVSAERNVLASDVSVARFQLLNEATLRLLAVA